MNKQQLASKIWASANKMRSNMDASEYKDYILGFIFYKYLSDKEIEFLKKEHWDDKDIETELSYEEGEDGVILKNPDPETVEHCKDKLGYFIPYNFLYSTWRNDSEKCTIGSVTDGLNNFAKNIGKKHEKVFVNIFEALGNGLKKLGENASSQTKTIRELLDLIKEIPTNGKQGYDVLGYIYEYLIGNFASSAGKKAGEFYTPHEVSFLMAEIVGEHLKNKKQITIYDPTSGSGSLLLNIGRVAGKYIKDKNAISYYAQEWNPTTFNLTRMNLVMRNILPDNIFVRNGDTLKEDWPLFDETDKDNTYKRLYCDAVVSNPPYSQPWTPHKDPRYAEYGLAPKGKADYAFLLHDLYHVKPDGIMAIVLPHGVLFRGKAGKVNGKGIQEEGEAEYEIRKNLIENNKIDAVIGLPSNIFYGTGIPTIIMILKQNRGIADDILIVDASQGFEKEGKKNKLRASDIKHIADVVIGKKTEEKFSRLVTRDEIRANGYNLNIPRYVDSSDKAEKWDVYSLMFGGIPQSEINELKQLWEVFPSLKKELFKELNNHCAELKTNNIIDTINNNEEVKQYQKTYKNKFKDFDSFLYKDLIENVLKVNIAKEENVVAEKVFSYLSDIALIDKYQAYQILDNQWKIIENDLEFIQTEGFETTKVVEPNMVIKKKKDIEEEVQDGYKGHILPFNLVQEVLLADELNEIKKIEQRITDIQAKREELLGSIEEEYLDKITNDEGKYTKDNFNKCFDEILENVSTEEIETLYQYLEIPQNEKLKFMEKHKEIDWDSMEKGQKGFVNLKPIKDKIEELRLNYSFDEDSSENIIIALKKLEREESELSTRLNGGKKTIGLKDELHSKTKDTIEKLTDEQVKDLLQKKWISPLCSKLDDLPKQLFSSIVSNLCALAKKYSVTYADLATESDKAEKELHTMIGDLTGSDFDMKGLKEFQSTLKSE